VNNQYEKLLSGFKDDVYELRLKTFCFGGSSLADASVHEYVSDQRLTLNVDTVSPMASHEVQASVHRTAGVWFYEDIDCSEAKVNVTKVLGHSCEKMNEVVSPEQFTGYYRVHCFNAGGSGKWVLDYPPEASGMYVVGVSNIKDAAGNVAPDYLLTLKAGEGSMDCSGLFCDVNHHVVNKACTPCPEGSGRAAGDDSRGMDTTCDAIASPSTPARDTTSRLGATARLSSEATKSKTKTTKTKTTPRSSSSSSASLVVLTALASFALGIAYTEVRRRASVARSKLPPTSWTSLLGVKARADAGARRPPPNYGAAV